MASGTVIAGAAAMRVRGVVYNCDVVAGTLGGYQYTKVVGMPSSLCTIGGPSVTWISATWPSVTCAPPGTAIGRSRNAATESRVVRG